MAELQGLGFAVQTSPLIGGPDPRPADFEPAVVRDDGHEPSAADGSAARQVDRCERDVDARRRAGDRSTEPGLDPGSIRRPSDRQRPDGLVQADPDEVVEMVRREGLQAHAPAGQDHGNDPGTGSWVGGRHGSSQRAPDGGSGSYRAPRRRVRLNASGRRFVQPRTLITCSIARRRCSMAAGSNS